MITIINYKSGNIGSVTNALDKIGAKYIVTADPTMIKKASKVIFPGVGRAGQAMPELKKLKLEQLIQDIRAPFLGICLGMQLLLSYSEEDNTKCLDIIDGKVKKFPKKNNLVVPQIGWNQVKQIKNEPLFKNIPNNSYFYFVNSYYCDPLKKNIIGQTQYGSNFASVIKKNNFYGVQFHPEKSGELGQKMLKNFCDIEALENSATIPSERKASPIRFEQELTALKSAKSLLAKRIIACMDIKNNKVVKGTNYKQLKDAGDPVKLAQLYDKMGIDELMFLDITATIEKRRLLYKLVEKIAKNITIPFSVGGGIKTLNDIYQLLLSGADKVSIGSAAVTNPDLVKKAAQRFGSQCIVISLDPKKNRNSWEIYINSGKKATGIDALKFAKKMETLGAGELLVNSIDRDGTKKGYDLDLLRNIAKKVNIPIIASSGAGKKKDFLDALTKGQADAALAATLFHKQKLKITDLKNYLKNHGISIR
ncbi:MAG: imidazole glycerol phosphate synthase subunit HisF [Candidatus Woesebacteria bacterium]|jgi:cyclase